MRCQEKSLMPFLEEALSHRRKQCYCSIIDDRQHQSNYLNRRAFVYLAENYTFMEEQRNHLNHFWWGWRYHAMAFTFTFTAIRLAPGTLAKVSARCGLAVQRGRLL